MKHCQKKQKQEKHLFDVTVSEEDSQKQYYKFRILFSPMLVINVVIIEGDFVNENQNKINIFISYISKINPNLIQF